MCVGGRAAVQLTEELIFQDEAAAEAVFGHLSSEDMDQICLRPRCELKRRRSRSQTHGRSHRRKHNSLSRSPRGRATHKHGRGCLHAPVFFIMQLNMYKCDLSPYKVSKGLSRHPRRGALIGATFRVEAAGRERAGVGEGDATHTGEEVGGVLKEFEGNKGSAS